MRSKLDWQRKTRSDVPIHLAWPVLVGVFLCGLRWATIATGPDAGYDFETGYRVYYGGIYGKNFYTTLGPLSYELIGFVFRWLSPKWLYINLIYYFCWAATMLGIYYLLKSITSNKTNLILATLIIVPLGIPHLVAMHSYNFISYMLAILTGTLFFKFLDAYCYRFLFFAGLVVPISLFTKQNIGMGSIFLIWLMVIILPLLKRDFSWRQMITAISSFLFPLVLMTLLLFWLFSRSVDASEFWRLMFVDGAQVKGGFMQMLKTATPRMLYGISTQYDRNWVLQHLMEFVCFLILIGTHLFFFRRVLSKTGFSPFQYRQAQFKVNDIFCLLALLSAFIFIPFLFPGTIEKIREKVIQTGYFYLLGELVLPFTIWAIFIGLFFVLLVAMQRRAFSRDIYVKILLLCIFSVGLNFCVCSSRLNYFYLNFPLLMGIFLIAALELELWNRKYLFLVVLFVWGTTLFFRYPVFSDLVRIKDPKLFGLWFGDRNSVELYTKEIKPLVKGKRTLWLSNGGPHSLSESVPVRNVSILFFDQYHPRIEELLLEDWMKNPPEMIVRYWCAIHDNPSGINGKVFQSWVQDNYLQIAEIQGRKILKYRNSLMN